MLLGPVDGDKGVEVVFDGNIRRTICSELARAPVEDREVSAVGREAAQICLRDEVMPPGFRSRNRIHTTSLERFAESRPWFPFLVDDVGA
jgi:hypothetical protein